MRKPSLYLRNVVSALILAAACLMAGTSVSAADIPSALPSAGLPSLPDYGSTDTYSRSYGTLPKSYDSRKLGLITPVRNQNPWGTCWAFGALSAGEASLIKKRTGRHLCAPLRASPVLLFLQFPHRSSGKYSKRHGKSPHHRLQLPGIRWKQPLHDV